MAAKKVQVDIDINSGSVKIANQETLNLQQQIKILTAELRKTQVGSAEFEILSEALKDNKDQMELVNAKSKDLFASFSQIPGPIGDIGFGLDDTVGKLKVFSAFNLKDLKTQFKALGGDFVDIGKNLSQVTGLSKLFTATTNLTAKALNGVGISANASSKGLKIFSGALVATGIGAIVVALGMLISNFDKVRDALYKMIPGLKAVGDAIGNMINFFTDLVGITSEAERAEAKRQETYAKAAAGTKIVNEGIQRQINILKAQGATQDEIDKKRKEMIKNEINDLKKAANEKGVLYGEQAKQYKDLNNELAVIDAEATKRSADEADKKNKDRQQKADAANQKAIAADKQFRQEQADAAVELAKRGEDTQENVLREALKKQYAIKNEGKKISAEVAKLQADEIEQIVKEEVNKDKETRQKAFTERLQNQKDVAKQELDTITETYEAKKIKYGEDSKEARQAQDQIFAKTAENLAKEKSALLEQQKTKDGITAEELKRLGDIAVEEQKLTNTKNAENQKRTKSDFETFLKAKENEKIARDEKFARDMEAAALDLQQRQQILDARSAQEKKFYEDLLANEQLTAEQRKKIDEEYTKVKKENADAQKAIDQQKADNEVKLLQAVSQGLKIAADELGKDTIAGKSLAVAGATIDTYGAIAAILKAAGKGPLGGVPGYAIAQSILAGYAGFKAVQGIMNTPVPGGGGGGSAPMPQPRALASGGYVRGPGGPKSDLIPAMLSNGESVINANSTSMFRPLLSTINHIGGGRKFASGGIAGGSDFSSASMNALNDALMVTQNQQPIKTYVVAQDMTNVQSFDRAQKSRSTL
jgi:hypothetical protein